MTENVSFAATSSMRRTDTSTPTRPSVPGAPGDKAALRLAAAGSAQVSAPQRQEPFSGCSEMSKVSIDLTLRDAGSHTLRVLGVPLAGRASGETLEALLLPSFRIQFAPPG